MNCGHEGKGGAFGWYLVCEYSPPGNVQGQYMYNVQKPGESGGKLGFGSSALRANRSSRILVALVAMSVLAALWL